MTTSLSVTDDLSAARPLLFAYYNATAAEMGHAGWADPADLPDYFSNDYRDPAAFYAPPGGYLVARNGEDVLGGVGHHPIAVADGTAVEVKRLYVTPEARGAGVGRALMDELHARARALGVTQCVLDVLPQRKGAIALYESLGYRQTGPYRDDHGPVDLHCFALDL